MSCLVTDLAGSREVYSITSYADLFFQDFHVPVTVRTLYPCKSALVILVVSSNATASHVTNIYAIVARQIKIDLSTCFAQTYLIPTLSKRTSNAEDPLLIALVGGSKLTQCGSIPATSAERMILRSLAVKLR